MHEDRNLIASGQVSRLHTTSSGARVTGWGHWSDKLSLTEEESRERISRLLKEIRTANLFYSVYPSEILFRLSQTVEKFPTKEEVLLIHKNIELILTVAAVLFGKYKKIDIPLQLRCDTPILSLQSRRTDREIDGRHTERDFNFVEEFFKDYLSPNDNKEALVSAIKTYLYQMQDIVERDFIRKDRNRFVKVNEAVKNFLKGIFQSSIQLFFPSILARLRMGGLIQEQDNIGRDGQSLACYLDSFEGLDKIEVFKELNYAVGLWMTYPRGFDKYEFMEIWRRN